MNCTESIKAEIDTLLSAYRSKAAIPSNKLHLEFQDFRNSLWSENEKLSQDLLQPWLSIFEFGLEWLAHVHIALTKNCDVCPKTTELRVPWALVGSASVFGWSLRQSCLTGFDTPARAQLRTYVETLLLCLSVLHDKELAKIYEAADTDEKVIDFWHKEASPKHLHRRIMEIENSLGFDSELITELSAWRREEYEVLSQSSHLSYIAAAMTCFPPSIEDEETHKTGIFGIASASSNRTISYAALTTWYFSRLAFNKIISKVNSSKALLTLDKEDVNHIFIVIGFEVLSTITERHWVKKP